MPGIDKSRLIRVLPNSSLDELICGICLLIFIDPVVTPCCRQPFCSDCINKWIEENHNCPNDRRSLSAGNLTPVPPFVTSFIRSLKVSGYNETDGCAHEITIADVVDHRVSNRLDPGIDDFISITSSSDLNSIQDHIQLLSISDESIIVRSEGEENQELNEEAQIEEVNNQVEFEENVQLTSEIRETLDVLGIESLPVNESSSITAADNERVLNSSFKTIAECIPRINTNEMSDDSDDVKIMFQHPYDPHTCPTPTVNGKLSIWDNDHVKMPNSPNNVTRTTRSSTWDLIKSSLSQRIGNFRDFNRMIKVYNKNYLGKEFNVLRHLMANTTAFPDKLEIINWVRELALKLPEIVTEPLPMLRKGKSSSLIMSRMQVACLLANAFFCTFPRRSRPNDEYKDYSTFNFVSLFIGDSDSVDVKIEKLKAILNYFKQIKESKNVSGVISYERRCLRNESIPNWKTSDQPIKSLRIERTGSIEKDGIGFSQVDFSSKFVGGYVLKDNCWRDDVMFLMRPELIASLLFTEVLADNEALVVTGCNRFNDYTGIGPNFKWKPNDTNDPDMDYWGRTQSQIVMIDAIPFTQSTRHRQHSIENIERELNKAFAGFLDENQYDLAVKPAIASGKWGCGAYNGEPYLKGLIQLMAASEADRDLILYTFGDQLVSNKLEEFYELNKDNLKVKDLYRIITQRRPGALLPRNRTNARNRRHSMFRTVLIQQVQPCVII